MATTSSPLKLDSSLTRIHAHGLDEASRQLAPFISVRYVQLGHGMACSSGEFAVLETMAVGHVSADRHKVEWLDVPRGRVLIAVPIRGRARAGTVGIGPRQIMVAHGATQVVVCTEREYASWFVSIPDQGIGQDHAVAGSGRIRFLRASASTIEAFEGCARRMVDAAASRQSPPALLEICDAWLSQARDEDAVLAVPTARCQAAVRARQYIDDHLELPLTLADICQASYSSPRALEYGFREIFGVSPITYMRCARLSRVRRELCASPYTSGKITRLALQWGFWHLSQFSKDYFELFGELPSMTLTRASGRGHGSVCDCDMPSDQTALAGHL